MPQSDEDLRAAPVQPRWHGGPVRRFLRWGRGEGAPDLLEFLDGEEILEPQTLLAVLRADQRRRWRSGAGVPAEWYLGRFPVVAGDPDLALDLIYGEYLLREEAGEAPRFQDYFDRFPRHAELFRIQVEFHCALESAAGASRPPHGEGGRRSPAGPTDVVPEAPASSQRLPRADGGSATPPQVPGYEILSELGAGGMGVVYEAYQVGLKRRVALKMLLPGARADAGQLARFHLEAEAAARLHHPNIVEIYEIGAVAGTPYFSQELIGGGSLARPLAGGPMAARRAAQLITILARAVHYAHQQGIIHRDLKPANVLLTPAGVPKIADFGLAKLLGNPRDQTQSGTILGSPCYMSPEQAAGQVREIGPPTDVYALGAILYEMLTGTPPFRAESPLDTLRKLLSEEAVRPSRLQPKVPRDLEAICLKCLEKAPRHRYASAQELAEDLDRFLNHELVKACPIAWHRRIGRWCRRKPSLAIALGLAAFALLTTIGLSIGLAVSQYRAAARIGAAYLEIQEQRRGVDRLTAHLAYEHGQDLCEQGDVGHGLLWLMRGLRSAHRAGDGDLERAFRLNLAAWRRQLHPLGALWEHPGPIRAVAFSPDGRTVATAGDDRAVWLWDAATGRPVGPPLRHQGRVTAVAFDPKGRTVLTGGEDQTARLWDVTTGRPVGPPLRHEDQVRAVAYRPDGRVVLTGSSDQTARLWDAATGAPIGPPCRTPDGSWRWPSAPTAGPC